MLHKNRHSKIFQFNLEMVNDKPLSCGYTTANFYLLVYLFVSFYIINLCLCKVIIVVENVTLLLCLLECCVRSFKGNGALMLRVFPYGAVQFMSYEQYKKVSNQIGQLYNHHSAWEHSTAGNALILKFSNCTFQFLHPPIFWQIENVWLQFSPS